MKTVFILADSTNRRFLSCYGAKNPAITPNLNRLADRGTVFDNHWCGSAPCMPARRDLMTGRLNFLERPWGGIEPFDQSLPQLLAEKNVHSHMITDHYLYFKIGGENYWDMFTTWEFIRGQEFDSCNMHPGKDGIVHSSRPENYKGIYSQEHDATFAKISDETQYPSVITMQHAADWLEHNHEADNFFLWVEGFDPHEPFDVPQEYIDLYRETDGDTYEGMSCYWPEYEENSFTEEETRHLNVRYKALLTMTDKYIGKIFDVLDRNHMWEDTMVIFTTDHGYMLGEHGYMAKNYMPAYNEVFHIPLIIAHPDATVKRVSGLTQNIDMFPTILELFGMDEEALQEVMHYKIHGRSLSPLLTGKAEKTRDGILYGYYGKSVNYTDGICTYIRRAKNQNNKPLNVYAAMPTMLRQYFGISSIEPSDYKKIEMGRFLKFTDYPVYKFPAEIVNYRNPSQEFSIRSRFNSKSLLFDITDDYEQKHPIADDAREKEYIEKLRACMMLHDAPDEQYERLGIEVNEENCLLKIK